VEILPFLFLEVPNQAQGRDNDEFSRLLFLPKSSRFFFLIARSAGPPLLFDGRPPPSAPSWASSSSPPPFFPKMPKWRPSLFSPRGRKVANDVRRSPSEVEVPSPFLFSFFVRRYFLQKGSIADFIERSKGAFLLEAPILGALFISSFDGEVVTLFLPVRLDNASSFFLPEDDL